MSRLRLVCPFVARFGALIVVVACFGGYARVVWGAPPIDNAGVANCERLRESAPTTRWLSLPGSRLVVNPFLGDYMGHAGGLEGTTDGALPLNLAYYVGSSPVTLPAFCFVPSGEDMSQGVAIGSRLPLSDAGAWQTRGALATYHDGTAHLTPTDDFGAMVQTVTVDLDRTPYLLVQTPPGSSAFDMKVNSGTQPVDVLLKPTPRLGATAANVAEATGWHGVRTFQVLLYALGKGQTLTITRVQFFGLPSTGERESSHAVWMPHLIEETARIGSPTIAVDRAITMPDESTVTECLRFSPKSPSTMILAGAFPGEVRWDASRRLLLLRGRNFSATLAFSAHARWLGVRPTALDWAVGDGVPTDSGVGVWRVELTGLHSGEDIVLAARFAASAGGEQGVDLDALRSQATPAQFDAARKAGEAAWNRRLARVPRPLDFTLRGIDAKGVTAAAVRRSYYRAWVFFYADTLPPMPENGFAYPQVCAGKPSLWTDGAPHSEETSVWDSAVAMQALALIQPDVAWSAASGVMSQVDAEGYMPGELLPAAFAQTFWLLYEQTSDRARLKAVYPTLKRYLIWRIAHPRWVWPNKSRGDVKSNTAKNNEFVVHEIVDMGYAIRIATALGISEDTAFWSAQRRQAAADYVRWFWPHGPDHCYQNYDGGTNSHGGEDIPWTLKGLGIEDDLLPASERQHLLAVFRRRFDPARTFGVSQSHYRFGDLEPIVLGLFGSGDATDASRMADIALRDVTRAGEFSEYYTDSDPPQPGGVRPSTFGARAMTDSVLWHNGVVFDRGLPVLLGMPGAVGVDNLPIRGDFINVRFDGTAHTATLRGPGLTHLRLPRGFRVVREDGKGSARVAWVGPISLGAQIRLEDKNSRKPSYAATAAAN